METNCLRCGVVCQIAGNPNPEAKMLRRSKKPGLCVNCAVHDFLRNTYPCNMLLASSGPKALVHPHIQEEFAGIMRVGLSDAMPDEIGWDLIVDNWDLPFPSKVKPRGMNPCSQLELDEIASGDRPGLGDMPLFSQRQTVCGDDMTIRSFGQLNDLHPGLGDDLKKALDSE